MHCEAEASGMTPAIGNWPGSGRRLKTEGSVNPRRLHVFCAELAESVGQLFVTGDVEQVEGTAAP